MENNFINFKTNSNVSASSFGNKIKSIKSPNSPLIKSPFIKVKIEGKNLEKSFINSQTIPFFNLHPDEDEYSINKYKISLEPFVKVSLGRQSYISKPIYHNSPKWLEEFEFEVNNNKTDRLTVEFFTKTLTLDKSSMSMSTESDDIIKEKEDNFFLGFQILPIKYIEKHVKLAQPGSIWMRLINKRSDDYFVKDSKHVLNIENHDPSNYKVDAMVIVKEKELGVPLIKISYEYMDFYNLWMIHCSVHTIIQREDPSNKSKTLYIYKLFIKRNDDMEWFKDTTFEEIKKFRNYLLKFISEVKDIPFPIKSIYSYFPVIGSLYSDDNNDVLMEKKFILDNFFEQICLNTQSYKLEEFNNFFSVESV